MAKKSPPKAGAALVRPLWPGPGGSITGSLSSDGRLLIFVDWDTGDLAVRDLNLGAHRRLTHKGSWSESEEFAYFSVVSPDDRRVAYAWFNENRFYDLRTVGLDGSHARVLRSDKGTDVFPYDWSPNGEQILALAKRKDPETYQIVLVSAGDGTAQVLRTLGARSPTGLKFAPDGSYLVYDLTEEASPRRDLLLLSVDEAGERHLARPGTDDIVLGWVPDGTRILFASEREGTWDAWIIRVKGGRFHGPPKLVKKNLGHIYPLRFTSAGSFCYVLSKGTRDVYISALDPATGELLTSPTKVNPESEEPAFGPDWSPTGEYLAYFSSRGPEDYGLDSRAINIRASDGSEERQLVPKLDYPGGHPYELRWSPDAHSLITLAKDLEGRWTFYRIGVRTGDVAPLVQSGLGARIRWPTWLPDGRGIVYTAHDPATKLSRILMRNLETGRDRELYRTDLASLRWGHDASIALSPDGQRLAFSLTDRATHSQALMVIDVAGGHPRHLLTAKEPDRISYKALAWTPDGRWVLYGRTSDDFRTTELWRVPAAGGEPQSLGLVMKALGLFGFSVHCDGQRIAFSSGFVVEDEVWIMENFLPPAP